MEGRPGDSGDPILRGEKETLVHLNEEYKSGKGALAWNFIDAGSKLNPNPMELENMGPEFNQVWRQFFSKYPDKAVVFGGIFSAYILTYQ